MVIYKKDGYLIGFTIDDAERMIEIEEEDFKPTTQKAQSKLVNTEKAFIKNGEVIPLIDIDMNKLFE
jgi:chemotaxis signal transduction protein